MITSGAVSVPASTPSPACHRADTLRRPTMPRPWAGQSHDRCPTFQAGHAGEDMESSRWIHQFATASI